MNTKMKNDSLFQQFLSSYIECCLWVGVHDGEGETVTDAHQDMTKKTLKEVAAECWGFYEAQATDLAEHGDYGQAGHDFFLTRNGHGAGFWDRGLGALGDRLTAASESYGSQDFYLYRGKIHLS